MGEESGSFVYLNRIRGVLEKTEGKCLNSANFALMDLKQKLDQVNAKQSRWIWDAIWE